MLTRIVGRVREAITPEIIGHEDCPILYRWTLWPRRASRPDCHKLLLHHFLPHADDRDVHDHPRGFWTFVLRGGYDDMAQCDPCKGTGTIEHGEFDYGTFSAEACATCRGIGVVLRERMRPGMLRYRPAEHAHRTKVHASGAWTIVLMGPLVRPWGFWRGRRWVPWRDYHAEFGDSMRCD